MDRENFYHWSATREIMEIIRRRNNSPETRRLVEQRNQLSRPGTPRRHTTNTHNGQYSPHQDQTKGVERRLLKSMRR